MGGHAGYGSSKFNTDMFASDGMGNPLWATSFSTRHLGGLGAVKSATTGSTTSGWRVLKPTSLSQHYRTRRLTFCVRERSAIPPSPASTCR